MTIFPTRHTINLLGDVVETQPSSISTVWALLSTASVAVCAYHGAKRHGGSIGWAIGWGLLGGIFPVITPAVAVAQGISTCKYDCR